MLPDPDSLNRWAIKALPTKNTLTTEDARRIEQAFAARLAVLEPQRSESTSTDAPILPHPPSIAPTEAIPAQEPAAPPETKARKRAPIAPKPIRLRDKDHRRFVSRQPCLICARQPCDPHHLRFAQPRGLGLKVSDEFTVPLCRTHHREVHRSADEQAWWQRYRIDALTIASNLWRSTRARPIGPITTIVVGR
jgi:hypothetical protein